MPVKKNQSDYRLAQKICDEIRSENREAISELHSKYQHLFINYTRQRIFDRNPHSVETVLTNFWVELLNGKAICSYAGRASLRTFFLGILRRRIIDENRRQEREKGKFFDTDREIDDIGDTTPEQISPEEELARKEQERLIHEALLRLADISPRDANLIRMHLEGLTHKEMALRDLAGKDARSEELSRLTNSIKKQFSRNRTGSMAKFEIILRRLMEKNQLSYADLLN